MFLETRHGLIAFGVPDAYLFHHAVTLLAQVHAMYAPREPRQDSRMSGGLTAFGSIHVQSTRWLPAQRPAPLGVQDLDFETSVAIRFDRETFEIDWARERSRDEVTALARPDEAAGLRG